LVVEAVVLFVNIKYNQNDAGRFNKQNHFLPKVLKDCSSTPLSVSASSATLKLKTFYIFSHSLSRLESLSPPTLTSSASCS